MSLIKDLGRVSLAGIFILGGYNTFSNPERPSKHVAKAGIPQPHQATILNGAVMMVAGTTLALDFLPKLSALALVGSLIPTTVVGHAFWQEEDATSIAMQRSHFMKNLSILGGLLLYIAS